MRDAPRPGARPFSPPVRRAMYTFLFVLLILDCCILVAAILLQAGKGNGLAASFGGASSAAESVIGSRQASNLLTKTSWWAGGIFLGLAFVLQLAGARARAPRSVLDQSFQPPASAPARGAGRAGAPGAAAPAVPLTPAAPAPAPGSPPATGAPAGTPAGPPAPR